MTNDIYSHKEKKKWATFTYVGKEVYHIIKKLFRKQYLGAALKTKNIGKVLNRNKDKQKYQKYQSSGAYRNTVRMPRTMTWEQDIHCIGTQKTLMLKHPICKF